LPDLRSVSEMALQNSAFCILMSTLLMAITCLFRESGTAVETIATFPDYHDTDF